MTTLERIGLALMCDDNQKEIYMGKAYRGKNPQDFYESLEHATEYLFDCDASKIAFQLRQTFVNFKEKPSTMNQRILIAMIQGWKSVNQ
jgi:hypothetical protein